MLLHGTQIGSVKIKCPYLPCYSSQLCFILKVCPCISSLYSLIPQLFSYSPQLLLAHLIYFKKVKTERYCECVLKWKEYIMLRKKKKKAGTGHWGKTILWHRDALFEWRGTIYYNNHIWAKLALLSWPWQNISLKITFSVSVTAKTKLSTHFLIVIEWFPLSPR